MITNPTYCHHDVTLAHMALFQQNHLQGFRKILGFKLVKVDAAGYGDAVCIRAVPEYRMLPRTLNALNKCYYSLPEDVVNRDVDCGRPR